MERYTQDYRPEGIEKVTPIITPVPLDILPYVDVDMVSPLLHYAKRIAGPNQVGMRWSDLETEGMPLTGYYEGSTFSAQEVASQIETHGAYVLNNLGTPTETSHMMQTVAGERQPNAETLLALCALQDANILRYRAIRGRFPQSVGFRSTMNKAICLPGSLKYTKGQDGTYVEEVRIPQEANLHFGEKVKQASEIVRNKGGEPIDFQLKLAFCGGDPLLRAFTYSLMDPAAVSTHTETRNGVTQNIVKHGNAEYRLYLDYLKRYRRLLVPQVDY